MTEVEVLDPRFDPEPAYWAELRGVAGLRGDWAWDVLATQAWCTRTPQLFTVLRSGGRPCGVVSAAWIGTGTRRYRFAGRQARGVLGGLDVRAPGTGAVPGWWFAGDGGDGAELLTRYLPAMRGERGPGFLGSLIRQIPEAGLPHVRGRGRLVRETEPIAEIVTGEFGSVDDWTATLSRKRRQNLRQIVARVERDSALDVRFGPGAEVDPVRVAELLRHNERKHHDVPVVPLPQFVGYLERLLAQPDVLALRYTDTATGTLVAIALVLDHPHWPVARSWAAVPPEDGGRTYLYFHFYRETVRWAVEAGRCGVVLGKKMAELKKSLGARLVPQYAAAVPLATLRR